MKSLAAIIISFGAVLPLAWLRGFVICRLWLWFIVPAFKMQPLAMVTALGISLLASLLTFQSNGHKFNEDDLTDSICRVTASAGVSLLGWFGGWLYLSVFA